MITLLSPQQYVESIEDVQRQDEITTNDQGERTCGAEDSSHVRTAIDEHESLKSIEETGKIGSSARPKWMSFRMRWNDPPIKNEEETEADYNFEANEIMEAMNSE